MTRILVTGGTGTIGRRTVPLLRTRGTVRILTRRPPAEGDDDWVHGDTVRGTGLPDAMRDVHTVVHLAGGARGDATAAGNIADAARVAGVAHVVLISVIGAGEMPIGYFREKADAEDRIVASGVPYSILRAAQLHEFVLPVVRTLARLRTAPRAVRFEPVDVDFVAARLAELTDIGPSGRVRDVAGPEVLTASGLIDISRVAAGARPIRCLALPLPGSVGRAYAAGHNLAVDADRGTLTWSRFLRDRLAAGSR